MLIPNIGVCVKVTPEHLTNLSTSEPAIRIVPNEKGEWHTIDPNEKRGLIVFIRHPQSIAQTLVCVKIVSVTKKVAFAIALN